MGRRGETLRLLLLELLTTVAPLVVRYDGLMFRFAMSAMDPKPLAELVAVSEAEAVTGNR